MPRVYPLENILKQKCKLKVNPWIRFFIFTKNLEVSQAVAPSAAPKGPEVNNQSFKILIINLLGKILFQSIILIDCKYIFKIQLN